MNKMVSELKLAKKAQNDRKMMQHIASVRLLCDVMIEAESSDSKQTDNFSEQELKAMLGDVVEKPSHSKRDINDGDANGDSIFDF